MKVEDASEKKKTLIMLTIFLEKIVYHHENTWDKQTQETFSAT